MFERVRDWLAQLFPKPLRVEAEGRGYRVNEHFCATQVEVRQRLEDLGYSEPEILRILADLNRTKYGEGNR